MAKRVGTRDAVARDLEKIRKSWSLQTRSERAKTAQQRQQKLWQLINSDVIAA